MRCNEGPIVFKNTEKPYQNYAYYNNSKLLLYYLMTKNIC